MNNIILHPAEQNVPSPIQDSYMDIMDGGYTRVNGGRIVFTDPETWGDGLNTYSFYPETNAHRNHGMLKKIPLSKANTRKLIKWSHKKGANFGEAEMYDWQMYVRGYCNGWYGDAPLDYRFDMEFYGTSVNTAYLGRQKEYNYVPNQPTQVIETSMVMTTDRYTVNKGQKYRPDDWAITGKYYRNYFDDRNGWAAILPETGCDAIFPSIQIGQYSAYWNDPNTPNLDGHFFEAQITGGNYVEYFTTIQYGYQMRDFLINLDVVLLYVKPDGTSVAYVSVVQKSTWINGTPFPDEFANLGNTQTVNLWFADENPDLDIIDPTEARIAQGWLNFLGEPAVKIYTLSAPLGSGGLQDGWTIEFALN